MDENNKKQNNGSEWRKWDLHVHAPSEYTCAKKDDFEGDSLEEKITDFISDVSFLKNISVIGITDYFSLDGYKTINERVCFLNLDLILPNIELRISPVTSEDRKINIHIIPNLAVLSVDDVEKFLYKFEFKQKGESHTCKKIDLIKLGKTISTDPEISDEKAFQKGLNAFQISYDVFFKEYKATDKRFQENTIIIVSNSSNDGVSGIKDIPEIRNILYEGTGLVFSGNPNDINYFLGKMKDSKEEIVEKYGSLKACIHGSDYHGSKCGKVLCVPDLDRFCWVKADPTFEGFKQIIYEPEDRVFIGDEPSVLERVRNNKTKYIRSLEVHNKPEQKAKKGKWFEDLNIEFNSELVAIIGNKGSGKSAISDIIGVLGNTHNAGENHKNISFLNNSTNQKKFRQKGFADTFEAKMEWADASFVTESLDKDIDITQAEKVKYLPQNYFESLTNDLEEEGFENTLKSVIFLHIPESNRYEKTTFDELEKYKSSSIRKDLPILESDLEKLSAEIIELEKKNHPDNKKHIENLLEEKEKELAEHEKNKPEEVKNPSDDNSQAVDEKKEIKIEEIEELNSKFAQLIIDIEDKKNKKNKIVSDKENLQQIHDDLTRFEGQINTYKTQNKGKFQNFGFDINELIKIKFDSATLKAEIKKKKTEQKEVEKTLKTLKEIESECGGDDVTATEAKKVSLVVQKNEIEEKIIILKNELSKPEREYQEYTEKLKNWEATKKTIEGDKNNPKTTLKTVAFYKDEKDFVEKSLSAILKQKRGDRIEKSIEIFKKKKEIIELYEEFKKSIDGQIEEDEEFKKKFKMDIDVSFKKDKNFKD